MSPEIPIFAASFFSILPYKIHQALRFYYLDKNHNYTHLEETGAIKGELEVIQRNLQAFIDQDDLFLNNRKIRMIIETTKLTYPSNNPVYPVLEFTIASERFLLSQEHINEIHLYATPETLPYNALSIWQLNKNSLGSITAAESNSMHLFNIDKTQLTFYLMKGQTIGGHERLFINLVKQ